jgi:hypothetical protein
VLTNSVVRDQIFSLGASGVARTLSVAFNTDPETRELRAAMANPPDGSVITKSTTVNTNVIFWGQAQLVRSDTTSTTYTGVIGGNLNDVGSVRTATSWMTYQYNAVGQLVEVKGASSGQTIQYNVDRDVNGRVVGQSTNVSTFDTTNVYVVRGGRALLMSATTVTNSQSGASRTTTVSTVNYTYDNRGRMIGASGSETSTSTSRVWTDARNGVAGHYSDKTSQSTTTQSYIVRRGQALLKQTVTTTNDGVRGTDGSSETVMTVTYEYNARGQAVSGRGTGTSTVWEKKLTDPDGDGVGTWAIDSSTNAMEQVFRPGVGGVVLASQTTRSGSTRPDGTSDSQVITVSYSYNLKGQMTGASGNGTFSSHEPEALNTTANITENGKKKNPEPPKNPNQRGTDSTGHHSRRGTSLKTGRRFLPPPPHPQPRCRPREPPIQRSR